MLAVTPALAAPRSIDDCESIKEADAYNLCLASFGPTRAQRAKSYPGVASGGKPKTAVRQPSQSIAGGRITSIGGGRVRMEFAPRGR